LSIADANSGDKAKIEAAIASSIRSHLYVGFVKPSAAHHGFSPVPAIQVSEDVEFLLASQRHGTQLTYAQLSIRLLHDNSFVAIDAGKSLVLATCEQIAPGTVIMHDDNVRTLGVAELFGIQLGHMLMLIDRYTALPTNIVDKQTNQFYQFGVCTNNASSEQVSSMIYAASSPTPNCMIKIVPTDNDVNAATGAMFRAQLVALKDIAAGSVLTISRGEFVERQLIPVATQNSLPMFVTPTMSLAAAAAPISTSSSATTSAETLLQEQAQNVLYQLAMAPSGSPPYVSIETLATAFESGTKRKHTLSIGSINDDVDDMFAAPAPFDASELYSVNSGAKALSSFSQKSSRRYESLFGGNTDQDQGESLY
jgi:hypothetical protein